MGGGSQARERSAGRGLRGLALLLVSAGAAAWEGAAMAGQDDPRLDPLFATLASAGSAAEAAGAERAIWALWLEVADPEAAKLLAAGVRAMERGAGGEALHAFDALVARAPDFAEGWNRRATLHYLLGNHEASVADIRHTLALEPRHFGALSGLALIREAQGRAFEALEALEKVQALHPRMPHLKQRVDALTEALGEPI